MSAAQKSFDTHRARSFRDLDGEVKGVNWDDPIEALAVLYETFGWKTPDDAVGDATSTKSRKQLDKLWTTYTPARRTLLRRRAGLALQFIGQVKGA